MRKLAFTTVLLIGAGSVLFACSSDKVSTPSPDGGGGSDASTGGSKGSGGSSSGGKTGTGGARNGRQLDRDRRRRRRPRSDDGLPCRADASPVRQVPR